MMAPGPAAGVAFGVAAAASLGLTPLARRVATRNGFLDEPREYRRHAAATPLLGGTAVILSTVVGAALTGAVRHRLVVVLVCTLVMWAVGTADDRWAVAPKWRVLVALLAAVWLDRVGLGWEPSGGPAVALLVTVAWVVGLVNAFNLMDNMDGACGTVATVAALGIGGLALVEHKPAVTGFAFALAGGCFGFLRSNLRSPARIFLGDGGSMPIGFLAAVLAMAASRHAPAGNAGLLVGAMLVGLPILDVALVSVSRTRRGVPLVTGGRDHLTHRLLRVCRTPRRVAIVLAAAQAALGGTALVAFEINAGAVFGSGAVACALGLAVVAWLDQLTWRPTGIAYRAGRADAEPHPGTVALGVEPD